MRRILPWLCLALNALVLAALAALALWAAFDMARSP